MFAEKAAHTDGDSIVLFRGSNVLSAGDVFLTTGYPVIDLERGGSIQGEIRALNHILDLTVPRSMQEGGTMVIPGHGRLCDESEVSDYRDMLTIIRDRVQDMLHKGKTLEEVKAARLSRDYDRRYSTSAWTGEMFVEGDLQEPGRTAWRRAESNDRPLRSRSHVPAREHRSEAAVTPTPQAGAPIDLTGYWVSLVTEDWRYRMLNAPKGDYYSIPLNAEGKRVADTWDPAKDIAAGKQCLSYGAPNIMREPARLHITWANDSTLKIEIDAGKQTRLFLFGAPPTGGEPSMQGTSVALWQTPQSMRAYTSKISAQDPNTPGFANASMASPPPPPGYAPAGRHVEGGHHAHQARIPAQQWRAFQRQCGSHGILRPSQARQ